MIQFRQATRAKWLSPDFGSSTSLLPAVDQRQHIGEPQARRQLGRGDARLYICHDPADWCSRKISSCLKWIERGRDEPSIPPSCLLETPAKPE